MSLARHISVLSPELNASLQRGLRNSIEKKVRLRSRKGWDVIRSLLPRLALPAAALAQPGEVSVVADEGHKENAVFQKQRK